MGGSILCKQWAGLRAEWNSFLSALSTMSAALGTMEVSCHMNAFEINRIDSIEVVH